MLTDGKHMPACVTVVMCIAIASHAMCIYLLSWDQLVAVLTRLLFETAHGQM